MVSLYNCRHSGDQYKITKFDSDFNVEASYLCDLDACECPAGHRPTCRHRQMLPKFIQRNYVGTAFFFDFDRGGWVQGASKDLEPSLTAEDLTRGLEDIVPVTPSLTIATEITLSADATPDEVAEAFGNLLADLPPNHSARSGDVVGRMSLSTGLGQASDQEPSTNQAITYTSEGSPPLASRTTIRRRV